MRGRAALTALLALAPTALAASGLPDAAGAAVQPKAARSAAARPRATARSSAAARARAVTRGKRPARPTADRGGPATRLLELINRDRGAAGLAPLAVRPDLAAIAAGFSVRMAQEGNLRHNQDLLSPAGLNRLGATKLGENVGVSASPEAVHRAFMASPHHRANILDPGFGSVGISVAWIGPAILWVVEDFASPPRPGAR